ncbi:MAG: type I-C CRISPR-associated protein Cas7/Csd2 [Phycisphaerae bacterium]|jgi:CRISPR-associated protein Csd2
MSTIENRYDFVLLFDVQDGNPNGDPDAGNLPRVDAETGMGLVTDVCLKRKVRNFVQLTKAGEEGFDIFIKEKAILNQLIEGAYDDLNLMINPKTKKGSTEQVPKARARMCEKYYDIRTFGAVMSTGANAGQVRGPVQFTFGRSVEPIVTLEHSITRMAVATEKEAEKQDGDNRTMGRKNTVPYGLYVSHGFVSANLAAQTGFDSADLSLLWQALSQMFEHDRSAARGLMSTRALIVFKHDSALGNASAADLFDRVQISRNEDIDVPRSFKDYKLSIDETDLPEGVVIERLL